MGPHVFLFIEHTSESLSRRLYLERFSSEPFLQWWLERFRSRHPGVTLGIVTTSEGEGLRILRSGLCPPWSRIISSKQGNKTSALVAAASQVECPYFVVCNLEYAFAPPAMLDLVLAHHRKFGNNYTLVAGLPAAVAPEVFETELLASLSRLQLPNLPPEPSTALEQLRWLGTQGVGLPVTLRHQAFDASAHYEIPCAELPDRMRLRSADDLRMALEVVTQSKLSCDPLAELKAWKRHLVSRNDDLRRRGSVIASQVRTTRERNDSPRILFVSDQSAFSGAEASLCQLASHIDKERFHLFAAVGAEGTFTERLRRAGVTVTCPGYGFGGTHVEQMIYLSEVLSQVRPDIVHLNAIVPRETLSMLLLLGVPLVTHYRVSEISAFSEQLKASARVVAVSQFCGIQVIRTGVHELRVHVIYNEVDTTEFSPEVISKPEARKQLGIPLDAFVVLMIARFIPRKRHDFFLRAVKEARTQIPGLRVILNGESHGEDSTVSQVRDYIESSALTSQVQIIPFVEDVRLCHASADVLVLWSDGEALGRCIVEGMAMGLPVVVTDSGGSKELIQEGVTGFVRSGDDTSGLAQLLTSLSRDPEQCKGIGLNARLFAETKLDARICAAKMMAIYDSILAELPKPCEC